MLPHHSEAFWVEVGSQIREDVGHHCERKTIAISPVRRVLLGSYS